MKTRIKLKQKVKDLKVKSPANGLLQKYVFMQMKTKLIISFMIIILIPMIVFTIYSIVSSTDREKKQIKEKLGTTSIAANLMLDSEIKKLDTLCINITNDNALKAPLQWAITSQLNDYCTKKKKEFSEIRHVLVYGSDGKAVTSDTKDYDSLVADMLKSKKGINGIYSNQGVNIIAANLIYGNKEEEILGAVVLVRNLNSDKAVFSSISKSIMTNVLFYDGQSLVFMANSKGQITEPKSDKEKLIKNKGVLKNDKYYDEETKNFFGSNYFVDYQAIKDINGKYAGALCVMQSDADLKKTLFNIALVMGLIFVFSLMFTLAAAIFTSGKFTKPIGELMGLMRKVESGNLAVQSQSMSTDEIGRLSGSFNKMVDELKNIVNTIVQRSTDISTISGEMDGISTTIIKDMDGIVITMNEVMNGAETDSACIQQTSANINEINDKAHFILSESKTAEEISKQAF
jgi:methyl-accepting chemotaxis protein